MQRPRTSFILDLDGTLVDGVYRHVLAWHEALETEGINLSIWRFQDGVGTTLVKALAQALMQRSKSPAAQVA